MSMTVNHQSGGWSLQTIAFVVQFVVVISGLAVAWGTMQTQVETLQQADERFERADEQIRSDAIDKDARLRLVEQGAGRMEAQLEGIADGIERLSQQLERLTPQTQP